MKIPDLLLDVFKKQHSEIESILPLKVEKIIVAYDPTSFEPKEGYVVHVKLLVEKGKNPKITLKDYSESIDTSFRYTYTDIDFVKFIVDGFEFHKEMTREEIFRTLFFVED